MRGGTMDNCLGAAGGASIEERPPRYVIIIIKLL